MHECIGIVSTVVHWHCFDRGYLKNCHADQVVEKKKFSLHLSSYHYNNSTKKYTQRVFQDILSSEEIIVLEEQTNISPHYNYFNSNKLRACIK
jgi:hypothetical protein